MKLQVSEDFRKSLKDSLKKMVDDRASISDRIKTSKRDHGYVLDGDLKEFIFQDETIYPILTSKKLMGEGYEGDLSKTEREVANKKAAEDYKKKKEETPKVPVSNGAYCVLAKYEPTIKGELLDMAVSSVFYGGIIFKAFKGEKYLEGLSKTRQIVKSVGYGGILANYQNVEEKLIECTRNTSQAKRVESAKKNQTDAFVQGHNLPADLGYGSWDLEIDPKFVPSCQKAEDKNVMLNKKYSTSCLFDTLFGISTAGFAPLKMALPVMMGTALSQ